MNCRFPIPRARDRNQTSDYECSLAGSDSDSENADYECSLAGFDSDSENARPIEIFMREI